MWFARYTMLPWMTQHGLPSLVWPPQSLAIQIRNVQPFLYLAFVPRRSNESALAYSFLHLQNTLQGIFFWLLNRYRPHSDEDLSFMQKDGIGKTSYPFSQKSLSSLDSRKFFTTR